MADQDIRVRISVDGASQSGATLQKAAKDVKAVGDAAGFTKQQLQQASFQITDIVTGLASGQSPFTVLVQQGGQLKDVFGGVGGALRAVTGAIASMITPTTAAVGALATLGAVLFKGQEQSSELRHAVMLSGNAAGVTAGSFENLVVRVAKLGDVTADTSRELTLGLVSSGEVGSRALETIAVAAARLQAVSGDSSDSIVKDFTSMSAGVAEWATRHNRAWHFVTAEQLAYIRALEDAGDTQAAMVVAGQALIEHLAGEQQNLGALQKLWRAVKNEASLYKDAILEIGRDTTLEDKIAAIRKARQDDDRERGKSGYTYSGVYATAAAHDQATQEAELDNLLRLQKRQAEAATDKAGAAEEAQQRERLRLVTERLHGENSQYVKDLRAIQQASQDGLITEQQRIDLLTSAAMVYGKFKTADEIAREAEERENRYKKMVRDTVANRAPRLIDIEAPGYEAANRAAEDNQVANRQRLQQIAGFGFQLEEQTKQINASLVRDERERGLAQIEIERETMQRRLDLLSKGGLDVTEAQRALDENIVAQQRALTEHLKPEWQRMVEGWKDATRVMRDTYDAAMDGILRDSEDAFVKLMTTGKVDLKSLGQNLSATLWRGFFRENIGGSVSGGAQGLFNALGFTRPGASGAFKSSMPDGWDDEFNKLIGVTDKQAESTSAASRAVDLFKSGLDVVSSTFSSTVSAVQQFISSLSSSGSGGGGGIGSWLSSLFGNGGGGEGITSGNNGLVDQGLGGGRAYGGPVGAGKDYWVGEFGPEKLRMFRGGGGLVTPAGSSGAGARTAATVINHHYHHYEAGVSPAQLQAYGEALAMQIKGEIYESAARPGRVLNRASRGYP